MTTSCAAHRALAQQYLAVREVFGRYFDQSMAKGNGGPDAQAQQPVRALFRANVDQMVRSNTMFQAYVYDGIIERDPWLLREPVLTEATA